MQARQESTRASSLLNSSLALTSHVLLRVAFVSIAVNISSNSTVLDFTFCRMIFSYRVQGGAPEGARVRLAGKSCRVRIPAALTLGSFCELLMRQNDL